MIGCDVSSSFSSRVTDWRYRDTSEDESAESESYVLVSSLLLPGLLAFMLGGIPGIPEPRILPRLVRSSINGPDAVGLPSRQSADNDCRAAILNTRVLRLRNAHAYPTAYPALVFTHNTLTVAVSTPSNVTGHSSLVLWGPEAGGDVTRWLVLGGLWTFVAFHGALGLVGFMLRQFEIARSIRLRPYNALAFSAAIAVFMSVFLIYPLGQSGWIWRTDPHARYDAIHGWMLLSARLSLLVTHLWWRIRWLPRLPQLDAKLTPHDGYAGPVVATTLFHDGGCILHFCMLVGLGAGL